MTLLMSSMKQASREIFSGAKDMRSESRRAIMDIGTGLKNLFKNTRGFRCG